MCPGWSQELVGHVWVERTSRPKGAGRTGVADPFYRTLDWGQWPFEKALCHRLWGKTVWTWMGEVAGGVLDLVLSGLADARMAWERRRYRRGQPPGGGLMLWIAVAALPGVLVLLLVGICYGLRAIRGDP